MLLKNGEKVINLDSLSYAANKIVNKKFLKNRNYKFHKNYGNPS